MAQLDAAEGGEGGGGGRSGGGTEGAHSKGSHPQHTRPGLAAAHKEESKGVKTMMIGKLELERVKVYGPQKFASSSSFAGTLI